MSKTSSSESGKNFLCYNSINNSNNPELKKPETVIKSLEDQPDGKIIGEYELNVVGMASSEGSGHMVDVCAFCSNLSRTSEVGSEDIFIGLTNNKNNTSQIRGKRKLKNSEKKRKRFRAAGYSGGGNDGGVFDEDDDYEVDDEVFADVNHKYEDDDDRDEYDDDDDDDNDEDFGRRKQQQRYRPKPNNSNNVRRIQRPRSTRTRHNGRRANRN